MAYTTDEKIDKFFEGLIILWKKVDQISTKVDQLTDDISELRKSHEKDFAEMRKSQSEMNEKADKRMKKLEKMRWTMWIIQWDIAEDAIRRSNRENLLAYGIEVEDDEDHILLNRKIIDPKTWKDLWEYDIVAINHESVVVVEVKNKIIPLYIKEFVEKKLPIFIKYQEQIIDPKKHKNKNYKIIGAMWWLIVNKQIERQIENNWFFAFTQNGNSFTINNKKSFRPKVYT